MTKVNTILYGVELYQIKTSIVRFRDAKLKLLSSLITNRGNFHKSDMHVMQILKFKIKHNHLNVNTVKYNKNNKLTAC